MLFNSFEFIFLFLPTVFLVYFLIGSIFNKELAKVWLIISSLFFYSWWNIAYLPILLGSIGVNFYIGRIITKVRKPKFLLSIGIIFNISLLAYFKYTDFFISNINFALGLEFDLLYLALPLAISFFTFQQIAYLVDSYRNETKQYRLIDYLLFVTFFPQLIAGPIVYHKEMMPQFNMSENFKMNSRNIAIGIFIFILGLFKKIVIADTFAKWANVGFDSASQLTFYEGWITSLSYTFQLYFDFSAYSDMAIGLALIFNIRLPLNFNSPYKSLSIQEFWRRWHMTLNTFLTKYLYIPLGGSKRGVYRTYINILIVFTVSGVWHGAGWTFIVWGALHGIAVCINRLWSRFEIKLPTVIAWFITFNFVNIAWVFFRATSMTQAIDIIVSMFNVKELLYIKNIQEYITLFDIPRVVMNINLSESLLAITCLSIAFIITLFIPNTYELSQRKFNNIAGAGFIALLVSVILYVVFSDFTSSEFIYFNF